MKRLALLALCLLCPFVLNACIRLSNTTTIRNDGSGTVTLRYGLNDDALRFLRRSVDAALADGAGEDAERLDREIGDAEALLDPGRFAAGLRSLGLEVASTDVESSGGWQTVVSEARFDDVNAWLDRAASQERPEEAAALLPIGQLGFLPALHATPEKGIGKVVLVPPLKALLAGAPFDPRQIEEMGPKERERVEEFLTVWKESLMIDGLRVEVVMNLPGRIVNTHGCEKTGERTVRLVIDGSAVSLDGLRSLLGLQDGVTATFEIPEGCTIRFPTPGAGQDGTDQVPREGKGGNARGAGAGGARGRSGR